MKFLRGSAAAGACLLALVSLTNVALTNARAILGVDLGSLYMKVALVQSGTPLQIVTNLHSKRKTEQMVLFDNNQRFYGADASALLARKSGKTPALMSLLLGRDDQHPVVRTLTERHYPLTPSFNETRSGVTLTVDGNHFTPEELVAMVLSHAVDISVAYALESGSPIAPPKDVVLTVPMFTTQTERAALLDAAQLADLNVLTLIDENTAAALHYAMDKTFDEPQVLLFYNLGASSLQVSLVRFYQYDQPQKYGKAKSTPALEILAKAWDETCGGLAYDHLIVEHLANEFNVAWHKADPKLAADADVRTVPRAMTKLRLQANKIKHVLSANTEIPVYMDAVHKDVALNTKLTRATLQDMAADLLARAVAPVTSVLQQANVTTANVTGIEMLGGGMRIPKIQEALKEVLGVEKLGMHINSDESFALGAAFAGANISTAFRVRAVGMTDVNPFAISIALSDLPQSADDAATAKEEEEAWGKSATIFKPFGKVGVKKTIAFTHDTDVHCALDYVDSELLPTGTTTTLERFNITGVTEFAKEMEEKGLGKPKVSLQFELSASGITSLIKAEAAVEETYMAEEEVEVDDEEAIAAAAANATKEEAEEDAKEKKGDDADAAADEKNATADDKNDTDKNATAKNETKKSEPKKPKKKIMVEKEKKKVHKKQLAVKTYYVGRVQPHSQELFDESRAKLLDMAKADKERMLLEESKNKVESYIYKIKNKLADDEEAVEAVTNKKQREEVKKLSEKAGEWLDDEGWNADLPTMEDKYAEISVPFEKILLRIAESTARPAAIEKLGAKLTEIEALMNTWVEKKPQVTEEERAEVLKLIEDARKWIEDSEKAQSKKKPHEDPAFLSSEVPLQTKPIEAKVVRLNRKPKPKPPKVDKNETVTLNSTDANSTAGDADAASGANSTADDTAAADTPDANASPEDVKTEDTAEDAAADTVDADTETPPEPVGDEL